MRAAQVAYYIIIVSFSFWSSESGGQRFVCMYKVQEKEHNNLLFIFRILISESISDVAKTYCMLCATCVFVIMFHSCESGGGTSAEMIIFLMVGCGNCV